MTSKKILFCASTPGHILHFHLPYLEAFHRLGYEVWAAANQLREIPFADHTIVLSFEKSLLSPRNIQAIWAARKLLLAQKFDVISTHTTLASAVVRAAVLTLPKKKRPLVVCTSHGYLFSEKDGWKKWRYLLPEKICAAVTDVLMVMNHEDLEIAQKHRLYKGQLHFIDGMGLPIENYHPVTVEERKAGRQAAGYAEKDFLLVYAAEFSPRKNQALLIQAFAAAARHHPDIKLLLAGDGATWEECKSLVKSLQMERQIQFLGYVQQMGSLYPLCDVSVTASHIEGLPFNVMESMACGLPVVASDIKGNRELVIPEETGFLFPDGDLEVLEHQLKAAYEVRSRLGPYQENAVRKVRRYRLEQVLPEIIKIYCDALESANKDPHRS